MMNWEVKHYNELSLDEFHDLIQLRVEVFVVEQDCPYQDIDGKDKVSHHLIGTLDGKIAATSRILPPGVSYDEVAIGRVVMAQSARGKGYAHDMMNASKDFVKKTFGNVPIRLSAQKYLEGYYGSHAFKSTGKEYLEDGIPHVEMLFHPDI